MYLLAAMCWLVVNCTVLADGYYYSNYYGFDDYENKEEVFVYECLTDVCSIEVPGISPISEVYIEAVLEQNEDKPFECRTDICYEENTSMDRKGSITWPMGVMGQRVYVRCPYAFDSLSHASRTCLYDDQGTTAWLSDEDWEQCPEPPLHHLLILLKEERGNAPGALSTPSYYIDRIEATIVKYSTLPIYWDYMADVINFIVHTFDLYQEQIVELDWEIIEKIAWILNVFTEDRFRSEYLAGVKADTGTVLRMFEKMQELPNLIDTRKTSDHTIKVDNIEIYLLHVNFSDSEELEVDLSTGFDFSESDTYTTDSSITSPLLRLGITNIGEPVRVGVVIMKHAYLYSRTASVYCEHTLPPPVVHYEMPRYVYGPNGYDNGPPEDHSNFSEVNTNSYMKDMYGPYGYADSPPEDHSNFSEINENSTTNTKESNQSLPDLKMYLNCVGDYEMVGSLFLVNTNLSRDDLDEFIEVTTVNIQCPHEDIYDMDSNGTNREKDPLCVTNDSFCASSDGPLVPNWKNDYIYRYSDWLGNPDGVQHYNGGKPTGCTPQILDDHTAGCTCRGVGIFSRFTEHFKAPLADSGDFTLLPIIPTRTGISAFLGFRYRKELALLGNILAGISLACLIATILSYAVFSNTRKGKPSKILMNLCVALICLIVILYLSHLITVSITGCAVANALRYYLVFVSLLWNAAEAVNMYLMIVMVFNSNVHGFVLKAGIVAWGLPVVMICVCLLVSRKSFHGQYTVTDNSTLPAECSYKCQLRTSTLYYAYLIPLAVIIINNIVIFSLVMREIANVGQNSAQAKEKHSKLVKVVGALATLVLLGAPWIFSAFGAIDAAEDSPLDVAQGVFQVIFIVLVNLQGLFIFLFHCVRNSQVRDSWRSAISSSVEQVTTWSRVDSRSQAKSQSCNMDLNNSSDESTKTNMDDGCVLEKGRIDRDGAKSATLDTKIESKSIINETENYKNENGKIENGARSTHI